MYDMYNSLNLYYDWHISIVSVPLVLSNDQYSRIRDEDFCGRDADFMKSCPRTCKMCDPDEKPPM